MTTFFSPSGNPEIWDDKPEGYLTQDEWDSLHPAPVPAPEDAAEIRRTEILFQLAMLDAQYFTLRVLAGACTGDAYALARIAAHEEEAAPLRSELALLQGG